MFMVVLVGELRLGPPQAFPSERGQQGCWSCWEAAWGGEIPVLGGPGPGTGGRPSGPLRKHV